MNVQIELKENHVYHFYYHPLKEQGWDSRKHCFEGTLIAFKDGSEIKLRDTYWGINDNTGRILTLEEAITKGQLTFYCDLSQIEKIEESDINYYDDSDIFHLSSQHACSSSCIVYYKRLGAKKSQQKMLQVIDGKIHEEKKSIERSVNNVANYSEIKARIKNNDLEVWL